MLILKAINYCKYLIKIHLFLQFKLLIIGTDFIPYFLSIPGYLGLKINIK